MERIYYPDCWYVVYYSFSDTEMKFTAYKIGAIDEENLANSEICPNWDIDGFIPWDLCPQFNCDLQWLNREFRIQFDKVLDYIITKAEKHFDNEF